MKPPAFDIARILERLRGGERLEIQCPLCSRSRVALAAAVDHARDAVIIEPHRYTAPLVVPIATSPQGYLARCPMSWQPITAICDGEHAAPTCSDPCCYHGEGEPGTRALAGEVTS